MMYKKLFFVLVAVVCIMSQASQGEKLRVSPLRAACIVSPFFLAVGAIIYKFDLRPDLSTISALSKSLAAYFLSIASFTATTALVYEVGKRGYISGLTEHLRRGDECFNVSFIGMNEGKRFKIKIGTDLFVWGPSMFVSFGAWKLLPMFEKYNKQWAIGTMMLGQLAVNVWAQQTILPVKYNPFIWKNGAGKDKSMIIFPSKWTRMINADGTSVYKKVLQTT